LLDREESDRRHAQYEENREVAEDRAQKLGEAYLEKEARWAEAQREKNEAYGDWQQALNEARAYSSKVTHAKREAERLQAAATTAVERDKGPVVRLGPSFVRG